MFLYLVQSGILPTRNSYVECECHRLGEFAVVEDVERGYGWTLSAGLIAAFVAVSQYSYLLPHHECVYLPPLARLL